MSSDSSDNTSPQNPLDVAVEGLILRPDAFTPVVPGVDVAGAEVSPSFAAAAREKPDMAVTGTQTFPLWALIPIIGVVLAAGSFLGANVALGPNVKGYSYDLTYPEGEEGGGLEVDEYDPKIWLAKGKAEYAGACVVCHQVSGEGLPGQFPPLKNSEWVIKGEERVIAILLHGIGGPLQVGGKTYNAAMPAWSGPKTNKQIAQIASYIRNEWGNKGTMIYDDQVGELRKKLSTKASTYTEAELLAIPEDANLPPSKHGGPPAAAVTATPATPTAAPAPN